MKKRGFTLVELITSFALASVIMIFIFNIVVLLKNNYIGKSIRTNLTLKQSQLSQKLNEDFKGNNVVGIRTCDSEDKCYEFAFANNVTKRLTISSDGKTIKYGDFVYNLANSSYTGTINVEIKRNEVDNNTINDSILSINLSIYDNKYKDVDFGINLAYQFNSNINDLSIVIGEDQGDIIIPDSGDDNDDPYGGYADASSAVPDLWTYHILNASAKTAEITGFDLNYGLSYTDEYFSDWDNYCATTNKCELSDYPYGSPYENPFLSANGASGSFYNEEIIYLNNIVVPAQVRLNSSGQYDPNGDLYTITRVDINSEYGNLCAMIRTIVLPDTVEYVDNMFDDAFPLLNSIRFSNNLKELPTFGSNGYGFGPGYYAQFEAKQLNLYVPKYITKIENQFYSQSGDIYIPSSVTSIVNDFAWCGTTIYVENNAVKQLVLDAVPDYHGSYNCTTTDYVIVDPSKFNY